MRFVYLLIAVALPVAAQMPDLPGRSETMKLCAQCHEIERTTSLRQDAAGWQETVNKLTALGMQGSDAEVRAVVDYLSKAFPAEAIPKLNVNKATAIELESALSLRRSQAAAVIEYRTKNGDFRSIEDLKKVPGIDVAKIESRKERLTFSRDLRW